MSDGPLAIYNNLLNHIDEYKSIVNSIEDFLTYNNLSRSRKLVLKGIYDRFKIFYNTKFRLFTMSISTYIEEYNRLIKIKISISLTGQSEKNRKINDRKSELSLIIKSLIDDLIINNMVILGDLYRHVPSIVNEFICDECNLNDSIDANNVCIYCGFEIEDEIPSITITKMKNNDQSVIQYKKAPKFKEMYDRIQDIQCKNNPSIKSEVFNFIREQLDTMKIKDENVNVQTIRSILKIIPEYKKYYKYDKYFVKCMTGIDYYKFTKEQEDAIMFDFSVIYDKVTQLKIMLPDYNYIIHNILRKQGIPCRPEDFNLVKTEDKKSVQEELTRIILKELKWTYYKFF